MRIEEIQGSTKMQKHKLLQLHVCVWVTKALVVSNYYRSEPVKTLQALQAFVEEVVVEEEAEYVVLWCTNLPN